MQNEHLEEFENLAQAIAHVQNTSTASREAFQTLADGRIFMYDDSAQSYTEINRFVKFEGSVSTVESFAELVVEYAKRFNRAKGEKQTVTFTSKGAHYSPDDDDRRHGFKYERVRSQQWETLAALLGKALSHKDLIRALQSLSPSIVEYPLVFAAFQRLAISKDVKLVSEPILKDGQSGNLYQVNLSIKGAAAGETTLPSTLDVKVQYARGSEARYVVPIEVDLTERDGVPVITLFAPTLPAIADQAVMDEMKSFDEAMERTGLTELLTVVNF